MRIGFSVKYKGEEWWGAKIADYCGFSGAWGCRRMKDIETGKLKIQDVLCKRPRGILKFVGETGIKYTVDFLKENVPGIPESIAKQRINLAIKGKKKESTLLMPMRGSVIIIEHDVFRTETFETEEQEKKMHEIEKIVEASRETLDKYYPPLF